VLPVLPFRRVGNPAQSLGAQEAIQQTGAMNTSRSPFLKNLANDFLLIAPSAACLGLEDAISFRRDAAAEVLELYAHAENLEKKNRPGVRSEENAETGSRVDQGELVKTDAEGGEITVLRGFRGNGRVVAGHAAFAVANPLDARAEIVAAHTGQSFDSRATLGGDAIALPLGDGWGFDAHSLGELGLIAKVVDCEGERDGRFHAAIVRPVLSFVNRTELTLDGYAKGMPTARELPNPVEFSERLNAVLDARGYGSRGGSERLAKEFGVKPPVASAWRSGRHLPALAKVRRMAQQWDVPENWLYWGEGSAPTLSTAGLLAAKRAASDVDHVAALEWVIGALVGYLAVQSPRATAELDEALKRALPASYRKVGPGAAAFSALDNVRQQREKRPQPRRNPR
jgi:hypothetical protein